MNVGWGKGKSAVARKQNTVCVLPFSLLNYCIFYMTPCEPTFAPRSINILKI